MGTERPTTVADYIRAAPPEARPHLRRMLEILKSVAPDAQQTIKWGAPFFVEPRFLFSFSAHKTHMNFAPSEKALDAFRAEIKGYSTTKNYLQIRYDQPFPEHLVRAIAEYQLRAVRARDDDSFW